MANEKLTKIVVDVANKTTEQIELTSAEVVALRELELLKVSQKEAQDNARESALAKLKALGLTEAEIAAL